MAIIPFTLATFFSADVVQVAHSLCNIFILGAQQQKVIPIAFCGQHSFQFRNEIINAGLLWSGGVRKSSNPNGARFVQVLPSHFKCFVSPCGGLPCFVPPFLERAKKVCRKS